MKLSMDDRKNKWSFRNLNAIGWEVNEKVKDWKGEIACNLGP